MALQDAELIILTPVFEDREASRQLYRELASQLETKLHIVAVDDGSVAEPVMVDDLIEAGVDGTVLSLRRNVGHQKAIAIGLGYLSDEMLPHQRLVVMDSDGEDTPVSIPKMLSLLENDDTDIVVAQRLSRVETLRFKVFYWLYKHIFRIVTGRAISFGNFMALKARSVKRLAAMQEISIHIASAVLSSRLRIARCPLDRGPRYAGQSKMNFVGLSLHGLKGLMVFAEDVLVRVGIVSAIIAFLSVFGVLIATSLKFIGLSTPGWFSVVSGILILMFLQTGALSLMSLMLTGVVRSGSVTTKLAYWDFIEEKKETDPASPVSNQDQ